MERRSSSGRRAHGSGTIAAGLALLALGPGLGLGCGVEPGPAGPPEDAQLEAPERLERARVGDTTRHGLPGGATRWPVDLGDGVALELAVGAFREVEDGDPVDGQSAEPVALDVRVIFVRDDTAERTALLERRLEASPGWHELSLPVDPALGSGALVLEAGTAVPAQVVWSAPRVVRSRPALPDAPSWILISADTLRADRLGSYGHSRPTSPNLDRLAAEGVRFEHAISTSSWTLPAHGSLFTGLLPSRHRADRFPFGREIRNEAVHLAEALWRRGYETAGFTDGAYVAAGFGFDRGFDLYRSPESSFIPVSDLQGNLAAALGWMRPRADRAFFLFLHSYETHLPYQPKEEWARSFQRDIPGKPRLRFAYKDLGRIDGRPGHRLHRRILALYDAEIRTLDDALGELFEYVRGLSRETCIVFLSDHGDEFWEHGDVEHKNAKLFEELVRVPLIFWCPSRFDGGRVVAQPVSIADVMPTVLELSGVAVPEDLDGTSLAPLLTGAPAPPRAPVVSEVHGSLVNEEGRVASVRSDRYKLVDSSLDGTRRLFDLQRDPGEREDRAAEEASVVERLSGWLPPPPGPEEDATAAGEMTEEMRARLRALGYLD